MYRIASFRPWAGRFLLFVILSWLVAMLSVAATAPASAGDSHTRLPLRIVRTLENDDAGLVSPIALAFANGPATNHFCIIDGPDPTRNTGGESRLVTLGQYAQPLTESPIGLPLSWSGSGAAASGAVLAADGHGRLLLLDRDGGQLLERVCAHTDSPPGRRTTVAPPIPLARLGLKDATSLAFDPTSGNLFLLSGDIAGPFLLRVAPAALDRARSGLNIGPQALTRLDLTAISGGGWRGLAADPRNGNLYLLSHNGSELYEVDVTGHGPDGLLRLDALYDLSSTGLNNPHSLVVAPSSDPTDAPQVNSFYVLEVAPDGNTIVELTASPRSELVAGVDIDVATLVAITHTYLFSPPSPDPAGIAYLPDAGTLLISDSEVNEIPDLFTGDNLFEVALNGALLGTASIITFSDEPTGVAYDANGDNLFFTDDSGVRRIYHLTPGPDGTLLTSDDNLTFTPTGAFDSFDPEGLAFDTVHGHLFIADGVGRELFELAPGPNQLFDGLPPRGDDWLVNQFDVDDIGIPDPEAIEFNHHNGNLYILSSDIPLIAETWRDGTLVRYIDISDADPRSPAGIAYAPSSSSASDWNLYIVDRAVDNDSSPHENDGELYELTIPPYSSTPPSTPTPTATPIATPTPVMTPTPTATPVVPAATEFLNLAIITFHSKADAPTRDSHPEAKYEHGK